MRYTAIFSLKNKLINNNNKLFYVLDSVDQVDVEAENTEDALQQAMSMMEKAKDMVFEKEIRNSQNWEIITK